MQSKSIAQPRNFCPLLSVTWTSPQKENQLAIISTTSGIKPFVVVKQCETMPLAGTNFQELGHRQSQGEILTKIGHSFYSPVVAVKGNYLVSGEKNEKISQVPDRFLARAVLVGNLSWIDCSANHLRRSLHGGVERIRKRSL